MAKILIIDDEKSIRKTLREILEYEKYQVDEAMDGIEVLDKIIEMAIDASVVMISGHGNIETAVEAVKKGAFDFIAKPLDLNRLLVTIRNAMDKGTLVAETK